MKKEVWRTRIYFKGKKKPIDILQEEILRDDNAMDAAQGIAHKIFNKKYYHFKEKEKEIYIPIGDVMKVVVDKISVKEEENGEEKD